MCCVPKVLDRRPHGGLDERDYWSVGAIADDQLSLPLAPGRGGGTTCPQTDQTRGC